MSPVLIVAALLGKMKLLKPLTRHKKDRLTGSPAYQ